MVLEWIAPWIAGLVMFAAGIAYFEWRLRRVEGLLFDEAIEFAERTLFDVTVQDTSEGPRKQIRGLSARVLPYAEAITASFLALAAKQVKLKLPQAAPLTATGELDLGAALSLLPKRYQGIAAMALPLLQKFLPGILGGMGGSEGVQRPSAPSGGTGALPAHLRHASKEEK